MNKVLEAIKYFAIGVAAIIISPIIIIYAPFVVIHGLGEIVYERLKNGNL